MKHFFYAFAFMALVAAGCSHLQAEPNPDAEYCTMIKLYQTSHGENGWPPYRGRGVCEVVVL